MNYHIKTISFLFAVVLLFSTSGCMTNKQKNDKPINIMALMHPKEGKTEELRNALLSLVEPTHSESGCILYNIYEEEDCSFFLYEIWRSQANLDEHLQKPYLIDFLSKTDSLLEGANDAHFGKAIMTSKENGEKVINSADTSAIYICSVKYAKEGKTEELRKALLSLVKPTHREEGCIAYDIYEEKDGTLFMYEAWRSREDFENHLRQPYLIDFIDKSDSLVEKNIVRFGKLISAIKMP